MISECREDSRGIYLDTLPGTNMEVEDCSLDFSSRECIWHMVLMPCKYRAEKCIIIPLPREYSAECLSLSLFLLVCDLSPLSLPQDAGLHLPSFPENPWD